jgi:hypothetical protein
MNCMIRHLAPGYPVCGQACQNDPPMRLPRYMKVAFYHTAICHVAWITEGE